MFMSLIHVQIFSALPYIPLHEGERSFLSRFHFFLPLTLFLVSNLIPLFFSCLFFAIGLLTWRSSFFLGTVVVYRLVLFESVFTGIFAQDQGVLGILVMEWNGLDWEDGWVAFVADLDETRCSLDLG
jgi:hypothetical protein